MKKILWIGFFCFVALVSYLERYTLLVWGAEGLLSLWAMVDQEGRTATYGEVKISDEKLVITDLSLVAPSYQLTVDRIEVDLHFPLSLTLGRPHLCIAERSRNHKNGPDKPQIPAWCAAAHWKMEQGMLEINGKVFGFAFSSGDFPDEIGSLQIFDHPESATALLLLTLHKMGEEVAFSAHLQRTDAAQITQLLHWTNPALFVGWEGIGGDIELEATGICRFPFTFATVKGRIEAEALSATKGDLHLHAAQVQATFQCSEERTMFDGWEGEMHIEGGAAVWRDYHLFSVTGTLQRQQNAVLMAQLQGSLSHADRAYAVCLVGNPTEVRLSLDQSWALCTLSEDKKRLRLAVQGLTPMGWGLVSDLFPCPFQWLAGEVSGEAVLDIEEGRCLAVYVEKLEAQALSLQYGALSSPLTMEKLRGEGMVDLNGAAPALQGRLIFYQGEKATELILEALGDAGGKWQGEFSCSGATAPLFAPWISWEGVKWEGELSLEGHFDGPALELQAKSERIAIEHPQFSAEIEPLSPLFCTYDGVQADISLPQYRGRGRWQAVDLGDIEGAIAVAYSPDKISLVFGPTHLRYQNYRLNLGRVLLDYQHHWRAAFDLAVEDMGHFSGSATQQEGCWQMQFDPRTTHVGEIPLCIEQCTISSWGELQQLVLKAKGTPTAWRDLFKRWQVDLPAALLGTHPISLALNYISPADRWGFSVVCPEWQVRGESDGKWWHLSEIHWGDLHCSAQISVEEGNQWNIASMQGSFDQFHFSCAGRADLKRLALQIHRLEGPLAKAGKLDLKGGLELDFSTLCARGTCLGDISLEKPLVLEGKIEKVASWTFDARRGLCIERMTLNNPSGQMCISLSNLVYDPRQLLCHCQEVVFALPTPLGPIQGRGQLEEAGPSHCKMKGELADLEYALGKAPLHLSRVSFDYSSPTLYLSSRAVYQGQTCYLALKAPVGLPEKALLKVSEEPHAEGVAIAFHLQPQFVIESIHGHWSGAEVHVQREQAAHAVEVQGNPARLAPWFSPELRNAITDLQLGSGYAVRGIYKNGRFAGTVEGKECELLGYRFQRLQSKIEGSDRRLQLKDLKIEDEAGRIAVSTVVLSKGESDEIWYFEVPRLQVHDLQPSRLQKVGGVPVAIKPFVLRQCELLRFSGDVHEVKSWHGKGKLRFTNGWKREVDLLDIPLKFLKDLGLDPGELSPIAGEVDYELRGDRLHILSLTDAYSEGGKTEFSLASDRASFIDLQGRVQLYLKVRQSSMLKLVEPFILTVRGRIDQMRYGLETSSD